MADANELTLEKLLRRVVPGQETVFDLGREADGSPRVTLGQRVLQPEQPRPKPLAPSPRRAHRLDTVDAVIDYIRRWGNENTVVLLSATKRCGWIVLDETRPEGGREVIDFAPATHPLAKPWKEIVGKRIDASTFATLVLANRRSIAGANAKDVARIFQQLRVDTHTQVYVGEGTTAVNGVIVKTKIAGKDAEVPIELPETITIRVPLWVGDEAPQAFDLDLLVCAREDGVTILTTAAGMEVAESERFDEAIEEISDGIGAERMDDRIVVQFGEVCYRGWDTVG